MKHDFTPDPEIGTGRPASRDWMPELVAIVGIFLAVWIVFVLHLLASGRTW